jgi:hypothetical protein
MTTAAPPPPFRRHTTKTAGIHPIQAAYQPNSRHSAPIARRPARALTHVTSSTLHHSQPINHAHTAWLSQTLADVAQVSSATTRTTARFTAGRAAVCAVAGWPAALRSRTAEALTGDVKRPLVSLVLSERRYVSNERKRALGGSVGLVVIRVGVV